MREIETDYLVVGAGASAMAFVDALIATKDVDVVMVDRRHRPGGHWLDAYPFVRLHQPSANYGVTSRVLGDDRIDQTGPNAGFYERATSSEITDYYSRVLDETLLPSGRVRFYGMSDYRGANGDGHTFVSLLTGEETAVKVRHKLVDATYVESEIPARTPPPFEVASGVRIIPPNDLVRVSEPIGSYTVVGAGKTACDTCVWLLESGVDPDSIRWIRPRDPWMFVRAAFQPLELVAGYMKLQAGFVKAAAEVDNARDFTHQLEADRILARIDREVEPEMFRGPVIGDDELKMLSQIENVVRMGKILRITTDEVVLDKGDVQVDPAEVIVNCTARGVRATVPRPVFEPGRITLQYVTIGVVPWGAATLGYVEAVRDDDDEKNRLCPVVVFTGNTADFLPFAYSGMVGLTARGAESDIAAWNEACRLNPSKGAGDRLDDPEVMEAFTTLAAHIGPALRNLEGLVEAPTAV